MPEGWGWSSLYGLWLQNHRQVGGQLIFILGSVVLVAVVAVVIVLATGGGSDSTVELSENGPITVTGDLLPAFEGDTATDAGAGLAAPILEGESFDGTAVVVEPGSPTLLVFLATGAHIVRLRYLILSSGRRVSRFRKV